MIQKTYFSMLLFALAYIQNISNIGSNIGIRCSNQHTLMLVFAIPCYQNLYLCLTFHIKKFQFWCLTTVTTLRTFNVHVWQHNELSMLMFGNMANFYCWCFKTKRTFITIQRPFNVRVLLCHKLIFIYHTLIQTTFNVRVFVSYNEFLLYHTTNFPIVVFDVQCSIQLTF